MGQYFLDGQYYPKFSGGLAVMCLHVVLQVGLTAQPDRPGLVLVADYIPVRHLSTYIIHI